jgi:C4-dicarboxylate-specific signal transduction histidine kinase
MDSIPILRGRVSAGRLSAIPALRRYAPAAAVVTAVGWVAFARNASQAELLALSIAAALLGSWLSDQAATDHHERSLELLERRVEERTRALTETSQALHAETEDRRRLEAWAQVSDEQRSQPGCPARELCCESRGRDTRL